MQSFCYLWDARSRKSWSGIGWFQATSTSEPLLYLGRMSSYAFWLVKPKLAGHFRYFRSLCCDLGFECVVVDIKASVWFQQAVCEDCNRIVKENTAAKSSRQLPKSLLTEEESLALQYYGELFLNLRGYAKWDYVASVETSLYRHVVAENWAALEARPNDKMSKVCKHFSLPWDPPPTVGQNFCWAQCLFLLLACLFSVTTFDEQYFACKNCCGGMHYDSMKHLLCA